jgi:uncharacterized protein (TIGR02217 family)
MLLFHDVRFPEDVSWGSRGGPQFKTNIFESLQGYEKRNIEWGQPHMKFNAAFGIRTDVQMETVLAFFNARQGMAHGFRYKNWSNYQVTNGVVAVTDGTNTRFGLYKTYGTEWSRMYKRLYKIVVGTVTNVQVLGIPLTEGVDFTIDYNSGEIIFVTTYPSGSIVTAATLEFDEPVRFDFDNMQVVLDAWNSNSLAQLPLVGFRGDFTAGTSFAPGGTPAGTDPFYGFTTLLLAFDDADGATSTTDFSAQAQSVTFTGTAAISRSAFTHGLGSLLPGTGGVNVPGAPAQLGDKPMTIEVFARKPLTGENMQPMVSQWDETNDQRGWTLRYNKTTERIEFALSGGGNVETLLLSYPWDPIDQTHFDYITIDRLPNGWYVMRIEGIVVQTARDLTTVHPSTAVVSVGVYADSPLFTGPFQENIDAVRVTTGRVRHDNFIDIDVPLPYDVA